MDPQLVNYFTKLLNDLSNFLAAYARVEARFQEGFDREVDDVLAGLVFPTPSDIDHLDPDNVGDAFAAFAALQTTMNANSRARWTALLEVIRSWNS